MIQPSQNFQFILGDFSWRKGSSPIFLLSEETEETIYEVQCATKDCLLLLLYQLNVIYLILTGQILKTLMRIVNYTAIGTVKFCFRCKVLLS